MVVQEFSSHSTPARELVSSVMRWRGPSLGKGTRVNRAIVLVQYGGYSSQARTTTVEEKIKSSSINTQVEDCEGLNLHCNGKINLQS